VACVVAVACIQTFKGYGVVHDRVELDSLDRFDLPRPEFSCPLLLDRPQPSEARARKMAFEVCVGKGQADVAVVMVATGEAE
jgi:hypothetical protein